MDSLLFNQYNCNRTWCDLPPKYHSVIVYRYSNAYFNKFYNGPVMSSVHVEPNPLVAGPTNCATELLPAVADRFLHTIDVSYAGGVLAVLLLVRQTRYTVYTLLRTRAYSCWTA